METSSYSRIADALIQRNINIRATISDYVMVTPTLARVVATFNSLTAPQEVLSAALSHALNNVATPIEGSWRSIETSGNPALVGFVSSNRSIVPYTPETAKNKVALSSNMLMDASDESLWELRSDGAGGKTLCRQEGDSLERLMETARVRQPRAPRLESILSGVDPQNFIAYVDPVTETVGYGYVIATGLEMKPVPVGGLLLDDVDMSSEGVEVLPMTEPDNTSDESTGEGNRIMQRMIDERSPITVPCSLVIESAYMNGDDTHKEVAEPASTGNRAAMIDYYTRLYSYNKPYLEMVKKIIENHANL